MIQKANDPDPVYLSKGKKKKDPDPGCLQLNDHPLRHLIILDMQFELDSPAKTSQI